MWRAGMPVYLTPVAEVIHLDGQAMNSAVSRRLIRQVHRAAALLPEENYSTGRYLALRAIIATVALVRLTLLLGLAALAPRPNA